MRRYIECERCGDGVSADWRDVEQSKLCDRCERVVEYDNQTNHEQ